MAPNHGGSKLSNPGHFSISCQSSSYEHATHPVVEENNPEVVYFGEEAADSALDNIWTGHDHVEPAVLVGGLLVESQQFHFIFWNTLLWLTHKLDELVQVDSNVEHSNYAKENKPVPDEHIGLTLAFLLNELYQSVYHRFFLTHFEIFKNNMICSIPNSQSYDYDI